MASAIYRRVTGLLRDATDAAIVLAGGDDRTERCWHCQPPARDDGSRGDALVGVLAAEDDARRHRAAYRREWDMAAVATTERLTSLLGTDDELRRMAARDELARSEGRE